jgi:hypothetical protein
VLVSALVRVCMCMRAHARMRAWVKSCTHTCVLVFRCVSAPAAACVMVEVRARVRVGICMCAYVCVPRCACMPELCLRTCGWVRAGVRVCVQVSVWACAYKVHACR